MAVLHCALQTRYPSLKTLAKEILGIDIQREEHNPVSGSAVHMKAYYSCL